MIRKKIDIDNRAILSKMNKRDSVIIFGCGKYGKSIYRFLKRRKKEKKVLCFADNNKEKYEKKYKGIRIVSPEVAKKLNLEALWIISSPQNSEKMIRQLQQLHIDKSNILQVTEEEMRFIDQEIHKCWYDEDTYFMYENGFPLNWNFVNIWFKSFFYGKYYDFLIRNNHLISKKKESYKYKVSICAIFLNEAPYMREWIEFHRMVGVEHFYLYNNMSTDEYKQTLAPYLKEEIITLTDWDIPHGQISAYWDCVKRFSKETKWIGFIDLDEFVVPYRDKIYDFLKQYNNKCGAVLIYWKTFGSSGRKTRDVNGLVIEDFKYCWPKFGNTGKCFYNTGYLLSNKTKNGLGFYHICWTKNKNRDIPPINMFGKVSLPGGIQRASKKIAPIQVNHYLTKSYEEYRKKMIQPDATFEKNTRTDLTFNFFDRKAVAKDHIIDQYLPKLKQRLDGGKCDGG